ncbi:MAG: T9SS type A sorting domain-containing protein [Saprospiraceae bacterium]|nr:T9SS type A sorting domain-containing protein [Saprospiraceae bacterium]MCF8250975.1 T9SS type A sorting domain-containing protein [Saprospiraceae bacterium]MCF8280304.1 T9SS type A sorting domain-containing protein [Bacteroidales bacterium]MCF8312831.1 T9SS type A sorting domain-containing protein [Saprospiraceae bacterium]MCF8441278.1 T9SS type A sorting domain-containing protein [Saprospiraceae bacterium]
MTISRYNLLILLALIAVQLHAQAPQIPIPRITQMPNEPAPFNVRDWEQVAMKYDSFVYDIDKTGQYLPLVNLQSSGVNYPQNPAFGLHTYVGTNSPNGKEAINILPSLVGATLNGIDKSNQFGRNWVLMSQDFFNKNNGELIYGNNPGANSGNDWWYDMMPNIYAYQLFDLYPNLGGDEDFQFTTIADRFTEAVRAMGGSDVPWQQANMNHRAWNFIQMQPNDNGVKEPEAAGAYAWVLYNAWKKTGNPEYLKAAEWSMEFLNGLTSNPSYELQLPYGVYMAARMNAEINTNYDLEKMVNWTFDKGPLRDWGCIVGTWGGFDVDGVIGEANDGGNDYAFQMNGLQQAATLAPMVRYDKRFARAIGKWMLNLANATRLFYPGYLPGSLQDASAWSNVYDPDRVIGYEALREVWQGNSPYSTGDALGGGWAGTNLALYGTSSIGYLGAILEKTNDPKILKIDLLKTDFFHDAAYPTFLFFNPYSTSKTIELNAGNNTADIYDALSETFALQGVSGLVNITIAADEAVLLTIAPANGTMSFDKNKMLINGVVVDYMQTTNSFKYAPRIQALAAEKYAVELGDSVNIYAKAFDKDSGVLNYNWNTTGGTIAGTGMTVKFHAPATLGNQQVTLIVTDESGNADTATIDLSVVLEINVAPEILNLVKSAQYVSPSGAIDVTANVFDSNGDPLTYAWTSTGGAISGSGSTVNWTAPNTVGIYQITVTVQDDGGLSATKTTAILVKNFAPTSGDIIAWYPFSASGNDISGNQLHGTVFGAIYGNDIFGNAASALSTDGFNDRVTVANSPLLNFQNAITVSCWFRAGLLPDKESFLLSHGSWQNRWKISITPEHKIRWTMNTLNSIGDLDSDFSVQKDSFYHLTATYDGAWMTLYINGDLRSYRTLTGNIRTTALPFLMAQMLPDNTEYNFKGILDEVKIFDFALTPDAAAGLYQQSITAVGNLEKPFQSLVLSPNPASDFLTVILPEMTTGNGTLSIFDETGRLVKTQLTESTTSLQLATADWLPGVYIVVFRTEKMVAVGRFVKG